MVWLPSTILSRVYFIIPLVKAFPTLEHPLSVAPKALAFLQEISRDVPSIIVCNAAISACEKGVLQRGNQHLGVNSTAPRDDLTNHDFSAPERTCNAGNCNKSLPRCTSYFAYLFAFVSCCYRWMNGYPCKIQIKTYITIYTSSQSPYLNSFGGQWQNKASIRVDSLANLKSVFAWPMVMVHILGDLPIFFRPSNGKPSVTTKFVQRLVNFKSDSALSGWKPNEPIIHSECSDSSYTYSL